MLGRIESVYASALLELAAETGSVAEVGAELRILTEGLLADPESAAYLSSRYVVMLLVNRGRLGSLRGIGRVYGRLEESARGIRRVTVTSGTELGEADRERIRRSLGERLSGTVVLEVRVDPSLIAGLRIESEGTEYELSVGGLLRGLAARLEQRTSGLV
jgi:F0F1-type ATP synthase delta subunit